jgi:hypothetical protein
MVYVIQTAIEQDQDGTTVPILIPLLLENCVQNLYDIYRLCVYGEKLLMMDRETVRNM